MVMIRIISRTGRICYDPETRDWAAMSNGHYLGSRRESTDAEQLVLAYECQLARDGIAIAA
jgi:hypothetical protein